MMERLEKHKGINFEWEDEDFRKEQRP